MQFWGGLTVERTGGAVTFSSLPLRKGPGRQLCEFLVRLLIIGMPIL